MVGASKDNIQSRCMRNDEGRVQVGVRQAQARTTYAHTKLSTSVFFDLECVSGCVGGTCTVHRAKHAQGDCVWITRDLPSRFITSVVLPAA